MALKLMASPADKGRRRPAAADMPGLFEAMAEGRSLRAACLAAGIDPPSLSRAIAADAELAKDYEAAQTARAELIFEEMLAIADDAAADFKEGARGQPVADAEAVSRSRLRIETRKWVLARMAPKRFSDKPDPAAGGEDDGPLIPVLNVTIGGSRT